jgi:hypothetical protein
MNAVGSEFRETETIPPGHSIDDRRGIQAASAEKPAK